eukprot:9450635-Pyramimonas_sp.AAC.1
MGHVFAHRCYYLLGARVRLPLPRLAFMRTLESQLSHHSYGRVQNAATTANAPNPPSLHAP